MHAPAASGIAHEDHKPRHTFALLLSLVLHLGSCLQADQYPLPGSKLAALTFLTEG